MYTHCNLTHSLDDLMQSRFDILSVKTFSYDVTWHSMMHDHDFIELFFCIEGEGHMQTNFGLYPIQKNTLIVVNPNIEHTEHSSIHHPLTYLVIAARGHDLVFPQQSVDNNLIVFEQLPESILSVLSLIIEEMSSNGFYSNYVLDYLCNSLILMLNNHTQRQLNYHLSEPLSVSVSLAKNYIDNNYSKKITLETLVERSHVSKYHLAHLFKEELGVSPINYLLDVRFHHAIELLKDTNYSVIQISDSVGFYSNNYFSKKFKDRYGVSPRTYRKTYRQQQANLSDNSVTREKT